MLGGGVLEFTPHRRPSLGVGVLWKPLAASSTRVTAELAAHPPLLYRERKPRPERSRLGQGGKRSVSESRLRETWGIEGGCEGRALSAGSPQTLPWVPQLLQPHWVPRSRTSRLEAASAHPLVWTIIE